MSEIYNDVEFNLKILSIIVTPIAFVTCILVTSYYIVYYMLMFIKYIINCTSIKITQTKKCVDKIRATVYELDISNCRIAYVHELLSKKYKKTRNKLKVTKQKMKQTQSEIDELLEKEDIMLLQIDDLTNQLDDANKQLVQEQCNNKALHSTITELMLEIEDYEKEKNIDANLSLTFPTMDLGDSIII